MPKNPAYDMERWYQHMRCPKCAHQMTTVYYRSGAPSTVCTRCEPERYAQITEEEE